MERIAIEREMLSYLALDDEARKAFRERKLDETWFQDPVHKKAWLILNEVEEGSVSDLVMRERGATGWSSISFTQEIPTLMDTFREVVLKSELEILFGKVTGLKTESRDMIGEAIHGLEGLRKRALEAEGKALFLDNLQEVMETYLFRKKQHGLTGYPYPWTTVNKMTSGIQTTDLIFYYGHPKAMKTWLWLKTAHHMWWHCKVPIVVTSREMTKEVLRERFIALHGKFDYSKQKAGLFNSEEEKAFQDAIDEVEERQYEVPIYYPEIDAMGEKGVKQFEDELSSTGAKAGFFDAANTLAIKWDELAGSVIALKSVSKRLEVPTIVTAQANRGLIRSQAASQSNPEQDMGGSISIVQQCDALFRSTKIESNQLLISLVGMRECPETNMILKAVPATFFDELGGPDQMETSSQPNLW